MAHCETNAQGLAVIDTCRLCISNMRLIAYVLVLLSFVAHSLAVSATGKRVLALVEDGPDEYSSYFDSLKGRGYEVTTTMPDSVDSDVLFKFGERMFDHVVIFSPKMKQFPASVKPTVLVEFLRDGGNLLVGLSSKLSESWRNFAREFGLEFGERDTMLVDHFRYDPTLDQGDHAAVLVGSTGNAPLSGGGLVSNDAVFSEETLSLQDPFIFRGIAHWVGPSQLVFPLVLPPSTAYQSDVPKITFESTNHWEASGIQKLEPLSRVENLLTGADAYSHDTKASLASAVQLRDNSARVVFVGSTELFQNGLFANSERPKQRAVVDDLTAWAFQERGVLRVVRSAHERLRAGPDDVRPDYEEKPGVNRMYRIKDMVDYLLEVQEFHNGSWGPVTKTLSPQLSAVMLDPYVTVPLVPENQDHSTLYRAHLRLPDKHGVFTLRVNWKRHGYTYIVKNDVIPVRPFNHDEYPRMLSSSWPYVAGALSTMMGFSVFVALWLSMPAKKPASKTL